MTPDDFARIYAQYLAVCERTGMTPRTPDDTRALLEDLLEANWNRNG